MDVAFEAPWHYRRAKAPLECGCQPLLCMKAKYKKVVKVPRLARRPRDAHKGDCGRVLVLGGSTGMLGAAALCANAAYRSGAGLVRVAVEGFLAGDIAPMAPCATFIPYLISRSTWEFRDPRQRQADPIADRQLMEIAWNVIQVAMRANDVAAIGPGWGVDATRHFLLELILEQGERPLVIDADGLNVLSRLREWPERVRTYIERGAAANASIVLTPHPGEMKRLLESAQLKDDPRKDREAAAASLAARTGAVIVLKGAGTVVAHDKRLFLNKTGNPGMATGGAGDVLTGMIAALIGQKLSPFDAAVLGVHVHGAAGDLAAKALGEVSMMATDILDQLPAAFVRICGR